MTDRTFFDAPPPENRKGRPDYVFTDEVREDLRNRPFDAAQLQKELAR